MSEAARWLRERVPEAPPRLLEAMLEVLPEDASSVPNALAGGALALYQTVLQGSGGREDALPLLAADALLTHAFHAQAEQDPAGIPELARRCGGAGWLGDLSEKVIR